MPTYEYRCPDGHDFERFNRKISDAESELPCPVCGKPATRRLTGGAGLVFKGSGFYLTDYGKNAHRGAESTSKKESGDSSSGESKSSESKSSESKSSESKSSESSGSTDKKASDSKSGSTGGSSAAPPPKGKSES
jgi:putative FmdB family regulatory protein